MTSSKTIISAALGAYLVDRLGEAAKAVAAGDAKAEAFFRRQAAQAAGVYNDLNRDLPTSAELDAVHDWIDEEDKLRASRN